MHEDLDGWIDALRGRIGRGELRDHALVKVGRVTMGAEQAARILLADLDHQDWLRVHCGTDMFATARRRDVFATTRRQDLLDEFRRLREQLG